MAHLQMKKLKLREITDLSPLNKWQEAKVVETFSCSDPSLYILNGSPVPSTPVQ